MLNSYQQYRTRQTTVSPQLPSLPVNTQQKADNMELHLDLDPQEVEYLENQGITEELSDRLTQVWNL